MEEFPKKPTLSRLEFFYRLSHALKKENLSTLEVLATETIEKYKPNWKALSDEEKMHWVELTGYSLREDHLVYVKEGLSEPGTRIAAIESLIRVKDSKAKEDLLRETVENLLHSVTAAPSTDPAIASLLSELSDHMDSSSINRSELQLITAWLAKVPEKDQLTILTHVFYRNPKHDFWFEFGLSPDRAESIRLEALFQLGMSTNANRKVRLKSLIETITSSLLKLNTKLLHSPLECRE